MKSIKNLFNSQQKTVLSAATIIMFMVVASRILGLVRQRVLASFFTPDELSLFFAAFRLPDLVFEVLVFGTFSAAFIPVFTGLIKKNKNEAWKVATTVVNIGFLVFLILAGFLIFFSSHLYGVLAPGFTNGQQVTIVRLTRILFAAQGFFVISYVLTAVLESSRRFLIPAVAPLFYNLGIIFGTLIFAPKFHLMAPVIGVIVGSALHLLIQLPLSLKLGFRFRSKISIDDNVRKIGRLALPRIIEVSVIQVMKTVELFLASLISTASYTYFTLGNTIQLIPVGLFGTSIAKASLPTLSRQVGQPGVFRKTLFDALYQMVFLILPVSATLIVLRIPIVRLIFGTDMFDWEATVQTGMVVSAFAVGVIFQAGASLLSRAFYAMHDTKTPVIISIISLIINISLAFIFVKVFSLPSWSLALAYSIGVFIQGATLFIVINNRLKNGPIWKLLSPLFKSVFSSVVSGVVMYFMLKFFDRWVWIKNSPANLPFERFVLDTRYAGNLLALTMLVILSGALAYFLTSYLLKSQELTNFLNLFKRFFISRKIEPISDLDKG
ncbi:MAG: murein biosynthesis integral membrane protein MurJ [Patescibacteria group bacterium]